MKECKKVMALVLALSMVVMSSTLAFAEMDEITPEHTHSWSDWTVTKAAACTEAGENSRHCTAEGCTETETEAIPAAHQWNEGAVTKEPSCTEEGSKTLTCTVCSDTMEEVVPALGHQWNEGEVTTEPSCTEEGSKTFKCAVCEETKGEAVPALGHDWDEGEEIQAATDTESGEMKYTCTRCEETKTEVIPAKYSYVSGQSKWNTKVIDFAPTSEGITCEITYTSWNTKEQYTQDQVLAMSKEEIRGHKLFVSKLTYTIPKDYNSDDVNIFVGDAINEAANYMTYLPGDAQPVEIAIVNLSSHEYSYRQGSFAISTEHYQQYFDKGWATKTDYIGFDGEYIPKEYMAKRCKTAALKALYDKTSLTDQEISDNMLGNQLISKGYKGGIEDLNKYYLDYYNETHGTSLTALDQLSDTDIRKLITNTYYVKSVYETNSEIEELLYNYFYNHLFSVVPHSVGYPGDTNNEYTVGAQMRSYAKGEASVFDTSITAAWEKISPYTSDDTATYLWEGFECCYNGPDTTNLYTDYNYGFTAGFSLDRMDTSYSVVTEYYTSTDNGEPVLDGSMTRTENVSTSVGETITVSPEDAWKVYKENEYALEANPQLTITAVVDESKNVITLKYYRNVQEDTSYSVVTEYYTSTNNGEPVLDGSVTRIENASAKVGDEIAVSPEDAWKVYNKNGYTLEENPQLTITAVVDASKNVITLKYYRNVQSSEPTPTPPPVIPVDPADPVDPVDPVDPQPLPPDDPLEDPDKPTVDPQPLPSDDPLIDDEDPKQPLPEDDPLIEEPEDPDQPKTGDEAPLMALTGLFLVSAGALGRIYIRRRNDK